MIHEVDRGETFGTWDDETSRFLYRDSTLEILPLLGITPGEDPGLRVVDLGGGNGLLRPFIPGIVTVDHDPTKSPDIVGDLLTHEVRGRYDLVVLRYVLHYLDDYDTVRLMDQVRGVRTLVVQFTNELDLRTKIDFSRKSKEGRKFFRTGEQLENLLPLFGTRLIYKQRYTVTPGFYLNRLGVVVPRGHEETLRAYVIET